MEAIGVSVAKSSGVRGIPSFVVEVRMAGRYTASNAKVAMTDDITERINGGNWRLFNVPNAARNHAIKTHRADGSHINRLCANAAGIVLCRAAVVEDSLNVTASRTLCISHRGQPQCDGLYALWICSDGENMTH